MKWRVLMVLNTMLMVISLDFDTFQGYWFLGFFVLLYPQLYPRGCICG